MPEEFVYNSDIFFIHGRPAPHTLHSEYAKSINAKPYYVDSALRWHDRPSSPIRRYVSYILSAIRLPVTREKTILLSEGIHFMPALAKIIWKRKKVKLIYLLDNEGLYFISSKYYSFITRFFSIQALNRADAFICIGYFQGEMLRGLIHRTNNKLFITFNGIEKNRLNELLQIEPDLESNNIVFIGNGPDGWRVWYKGLDILVEVFKELSDQYKNAKLTIVGIWSEATQNILTKNLTEEIKAKIDFVGEQISLVPFLKTASICVHPARGEAWGISVTEAMAAGLPTLVSDLTGSAEAVSKVTEDLITKPDISSFLNKIKWYFSLTLDYKINLSIGARNVAKEYTRENAILNFQKKFRQSLE